MDNNQTTTTTKSFDIFGNCQLAKGLDGDLYWTNGSTSIKLSDFQVDNITYSSNSEPVTISATASTWPTYTTTTTGTIYTTPSYVYSDYNINDEIKSLKEQINKLTKAAKEGSNAMANFANLNNIFPNAEFGPVNSDVARLSPKGLAIAANGKWQAYDKESGNIIDVTPINFDCANLIYKMPVGINQIQIGDIIIHARKPMFVLDIKNEDGKVRLTAIDIINAEEKTICPIKSVFGFDFYTKLVCFIDMAGGFNADAQNPFGNLMPWLLLSGQKDNDMLPLLFLSGQGQKMDMNNPMFLMALCGNKDMSNLLPFMLMANAPKAE